MTLFLSVLILYTKQDVPNLYRNSQIWKTETQPPKTLLKAQNKKQREASVFSEDQCSPDTGKKFCSFLNINMLLPNPTVWVFKNSTLKSSIR